MKIVWIDPVNTDPQFLNVLGLALLQQGHDVVVRSNMREGFPPPCGISWSPFTLGKRLPQSLDRKAVVRLSVAALYPLDWLRAIRYVKSCGVRRVLITTNLRLPRLDAWALNCLRENAIASVVIVHKPYYDFFSQSDETRRVRCGAFYRCASQFLVMTRYTKEILQSLYDLPDYRIRIFPHPHLTNLLSSVPLALPLRDSLRRWRGVSPVISFLSQDSAEHGLQTLLAALPRIRSLLPDARLLLVSRIRDPGKVKAIENAVKKAGYEERSCQFFWAPYQYSELLAFLDVTSVVIVPYDQATQSSVIALAAGFGLPVVATSVGGLPEMVLPGETGEIVPPRDPEALAEATARILADGEYPRFRQRAFAFAGSNLSPSTAATVVSEALREYGV